MSVTKETMIWCDGNDPSGRVGCGHWERDSLTAPKLRKALKLSGWTFVNGKDYCPACSKRREKK